jgi:hypothetical protein
MNLDAATVQEALQTQQSEQKHIAEVATVNLPATPLPAEVQVPATPVPVLGRTPALVSSQTASGGSAKPLRFLAGMKGGTPRKWIAILVLIVVIAALGEWLFIAQPWNSTPLVTSMLYQNTNLGFSVRYAPDWQVYTQDEGKGIIHFQGAGQVVFVDVKVEEAQGEVEEYAQQQATAMRLQSPASKDSLQFAGETWQHLEGTTQINGVDYHVSLLVTKHGGKFYVLEQSAVQQQAGDMEKFIFTPFRTDWKFLS